MSANGGGTTRCRSGVDLDSLSLQPENIFTITRSGNSSGGEAGIAVPTSGRGGEHLSGLTNVTRFNTASSHQRTFPDHVLENPELFNDTPYVPPRVPQAELPTHPALDPRVASVYDPALRAFQQQYQCEGGTSPSDSIESNWSTSSSSSASSQQLLHDYDLEPTYQYSQTPPPPRATTYQQSYPTYYGHHRLQSEHARRGEQPLNPDGPYYRTSQSYSSFLAPESYGDTGAQVTISSQMHYPSMSSQASSSSSSIPAPNRPPNISTLSVSSPLGTDTTGPYLRQQLGLSAHEDASLRSLPDPPTGEKPSTPLPMLIKLAIYGSPNKQLTLQEIYTELENRFQWFRDHKNDRAWKNSIRHNLSLNQVFRRVPRPITEPGKGNYWRLDVSKGEGYKRTRKRRPRNRMAASEEEEDEAASENDDSPNPLDVSQHAGPSQSSTRPVEDALIDPELRSEGHVVGEGRTRSASRRVGGSPYPQHSPRYQQGQLPVVAGQGASVPEQRFGQPAFGFLPYSQTQPVPFAPSTSSFSAMPSSSMTMTPTTPTTARPQLQNVASYDRTVHLPQLTPRSGTEHVVDRLPAAQRATHPESQRQPQEHAQRSSPDSSSSGSSRTWNDDRSGFR